MSIKELQQKLLAIISSIVIENNDEAIKTNRERALEVINELRDHIIAFLIIVRAGHRKAESTARRKDSSRGIVFPSSVFYSKPMMLNFVEIWRIRRQIQNFCTNSSSKLYQTYEK